MRSTQLLCAICVSLSAVVCAGSQTVSSTALSEELRAHVRDEKFGIVTSIRGLPLGVREELVALFGTESLDIAEIGAAFQVKDVAVDSKLPTRRLAAAGCSYDYCLVYYERGGTDHTWHVALFHWKPDQTRFEWGGAAPAGLKTIDEVRRAVVTGAIQRPHEFW
jgi:hypothetical protein